MKNRIPKWKKDVIRNIRRQLWNKKWRHEMIPAVYDITIEYKY